MAPRLVAKSVRVKPPLPFGSRRKILPHPKSAKRYLPWYSAGQVPLGTNAPPVMVVQPSARP